MCVNVHVGGFHDETTSANIQRFESDAAKYRALGIKFGCWGYLSGSPSPDVEADFAYNLVRNLKADFYIPNPEKRYSYIMEDGSHSGVQYARSQKFVDRWIARGGQDIPRAVISYGTPEAIDYAAWIGSGFKTKFCECFNGFAVDPAYAVGKGKEEGFENVIATIGYHQRLAGDFQKARAASSGSIALYTGENFTHNEFRSLK